MHKKHETHRSLDRCKKCCDSQHVEGFRCPASRHQGKSCHKYIHFSSLCYKKKKVFHHNQRSMESRSPIAHQLKLGLVYMQDSICGKSEDSSSNDSFCLQMQVKSTQAETKLPAPQHLITNLAFKLKPHKKTQYLRARIDTGTNVNVLPVSMYKLIFKDTDCKMLAPSCKEIGTYTTEKIPVIGSCTLPLVHPDTKDFQEVTLHITSQEGSVVLSCITSLELGLTQPLENIDFKPSSVSLISSKADHPKKFQKKVLKPSQKRHSSKEQSSNLLLCYL